VANAPLTLTLDGFGPRTNGIDPETGDEIERLDLAPLLVEQSAFVTTLAERVARLAAVRHASYVHLRRLDRPDADRLELISDFTPGWRLSELLDESSTSGIPVDITVVNFDTEVRVARYSQQEFVRAIERIRAAASASTLSPMPCPNRSLTGLKPSRSM